MPLHTPTRLNIRFAGDAPPFRPRWRCDTSVDTDGDLQIIVGRHRPVQAALASTSTSPPRLAIVIDGGAAHRVDCADLSVHVATMREARRACGILVALAAPRTDAIATVDATDLRHLVAAGQQGAGTILRRRGHSLVEAARLIRAALGAHHVRGACIDLRAAQNETALHDVTDAMAILEDGFDDDADLVVSIRSPAPGTTAVSTIALLARFV